MVGDGEAVIAGAGGDDAAPPIGGLELEQEVRGATLLEGAGHLKVLELDPAARARHRGQRARERAWRLLDDPREPGARRFDRGEGEGWRHRAHRGTLPLL